MIPSGQQRRSELRIGRYLVIGRIGRGGMGMVYRGLDQTLDREIAIKTLNVESSGDEESRIRFGIEARAAAKLQHPNVITVYELGEDRGISFIAMELLPGVDLETLLRVGEALLLQEKLDIVIQVCRGLAYAHEKGIVHRDIKPANIRLLDDGTLKIMDFGIAKVDTSGVTRAGMMIGTLNYMSPEQIQGKKLDGRSDVFSVGVLLHQLLAGQRPFPGPGSGVLYQICHSPTPELGVDLGSAGPKLAGIVSRALEKKADERTPSASRLADELSEVLEWYARSAVPPVLEQDQPLLADARRRIREEEPEQTIELYASIVERNPHSVEARRALRAANRRLVQQQHPPPPDTDAYPELEETFRSAGPPGALRGGSADTYVPSATALGQAEGAADVTLAGTAQTRVQPQVARDRARRGQLVGAILTGVLAIGLSVAWLLRPPGPGPEGSPTPAAEDGSGGDAAGPNSGGAATPGSGSTQGGTPDPPPSARLRVETDPPGASLTLGEAPVDGVTPLELTLRRDRGHSLTLALAGHRSRTLEIAAGQLPPRISLALEPLGPQARLAVISSYPVEVVWGGSVLARERSPEVSIPAGSQSVTLRSSDQFLNRSFDLQLKGGERTELRAPGLGEINIRANPPTCQVYIDEKLVDYPPINGRSIAAGRHTVSFRWPDGRRTEQSVSVESGGVAFVTGKRDR